MGDLGHDVSSLSQNSLRARPFLLLCTP
jgi:hypothetical protein